MDKEFRPGGGAFAGELTMMQTIIDFLPSGVTLFNGDLEMIACNRQFRELLEFPDSLFEGSLPSLLDLALFNAQRGEYGPGDPQALAGQVIERARRMEPHVYERQRPNGRVLEIRGTPLPGGGFVTSYTDITERKRAEEEARRAASYLDAVVSALPQGITVVDEALNIALWNPAFVQIQGLPEGLMRPGIGFADIIRFNAERGEYGAVDPEEKVRQAVALARRFEPHRLERTSVAGIVMEVEGRVVREGERTLGFVTTYTDITERVENERTIRRVRDLMRDAVNFSPTFIWEIDRQGRYTFVQGVEKILGYPDESLLGSERWQTLCRPHCSGDPAVCDILGAIRKRKAIDRRAIHTRHRDGHEVWLSCNAQPVFDEQGECQGYRGVDVDVTELTRAHRELEQMALHDPLTGLANRRKLMSRYELEAARQERSGGKLALLVLDVDHFKQVNDRWGHLAGDEALRQLANLLSSNLRAVDLAARFGGEEFVVLLSDTDLTGALQVAEKLRATTEAAEFVGGGGQGLPLTVSIGVAVRGQMEGRGFDELLAEADAGVYAAKRAGRNRVCVQAAARPAEPALS